MILIRIGHILKVYKVKIKTRSLYAVTDTEFDGISICLIVVDPR